MSFLALQEYLKCLFICNCVWFVLIISKVDLERTVRGSVRGSVRCFVWDTFTVASVFVDGVGFQPKPMLELCKIYLPPPPPPPPPPSY